MGESTGTPKPKPGGKPSRQVKALPFVLFGLLMFIWPALCQELRDGRVLRDGTPAKARVLAIKPTGSSDNDDQEVRVELEVQPDGQEPYRAEAKTFLHPVQFPRYQPGALVER